MIHFFTGELITGIPREVAEHYMDLHYSDSRNRHRKEYLQTELKQEDVIMYLEKVRERAERIAPPLRRTQETQTVPPTLLPMTSTFLLQEISSVNQQQQQIQQVKLDGKSCFALVGDSMKKYYRQKQVLSNRKVSLDENEVQSCEIYSSSKRY